MFTSALFYDYASIITNGEELEKTDKEFHNKCKEAKKNREHAGKQEAV